MSRQFSIGLEMRMCFAFVIIWTLAFPHPELGGVHFTEGWHWILWTVWLGIWLVMFVPAIRWRLTFDERGIEQRAGGRDRWRLSWSIGQDRERDIHIWLLSRSEGRIVEINGLFLSGRQKRKIAAHIEQHFGAASDLKHLSVDHYEYRDTKV